MAFFRLSFPGLWFIREGKVFLIRYPERWLLKISRRYFALKFKHILKARAEEKKKASAAKADGRRVSLSKWPSRISTLIHGSGKKADGFDVACRSGQEERNNGPDSLGTGKVRPDMIRRVDEEPWLINPSGFAVPSKKVPDASPGARLSFALPPSHHEHHGKITARTSLSGQTKRSGVLLVLV